MKCVSAYTTIEGSYPPFINFSRDGDVMRVSLRSGGRENEQYAVIDIPIAEWHKMLIELTAPA